MSVKRNYKKRILNLDKKCSDLFYKIKEKSDYEFKSIQEHREHTKKWFGTDDIRGLFFKENPDLLNDDVFIEWRVQENREVREKILDEVLTDVNNFWKQIEKIYLDQKEYEESELK